MLSVETIELYRIERRLLRLGLAVALLLLGLFPSRTRGAVFHTNATFNVAFSLPGVEQDVTVIGPPPTPVYTAVNGKIANAQIIQALAPLFPGRSLAGSKLLLRTFDVGASDAHTAFILRQGTNDLDLSSYMTFSLPSAYATVTTQTIGSTANSTNQTDYTVMQFAMQTSMLSFDLQGFTNFKMSSLVDHGQVTQPEPFPTTFSAKVDGVGKVQNFNFLFHSGSVSFTGRTLEIVQDTTP
jgi:hypothetical protein